MIIWWHRVVRKHTQNRVDVSVPSFDISAQGVLVTCSCGEVWAK